MNLKGKLKIKLMAVATILTAATGFVPLNFANAVTMSPVRIELAANPGQQTTGTVKIFNEEKVTRTLYLSIEKFESKDESGQPKFVKDAKDELVAWSSIQPSVVIPPLEYKEVPFTVNVPPDVDPGGYFAAVFASVIPPTGEGAQVALTSDVGTLLLFRVNGDFPEGEAVLEFNTKDKKSILNHLPVEFFFRFQNSGKDRIQPIGDITIKNTFGGLTKVVPANKGLGNVLPESIRRYEAAWVTSGGELEEKFNSEVKQPEFKSFLDAVKYQWQNFALGRYTAELNVVVDNDSSRSYNKHLAFWVLPWQLMLVILAVILVFVLPLLILFGAIVVYLRRRRAVRRQ